MTDKLSETWRSASLRYAAAANARVELLRQGKEAPMPAFDERVLCGEAVLAEVRAANQQSTTDTLAARFPPAIAPLAEALPDTLIVWQVVFTPEGVLTQLGDPEEGRRFALVTPQQVKPVDGLIGFGTGPRQRLFAVATPSHITLHDGWGGPILLQRPWPMRDASNPFSPADDEFQLCAIPRSADLDARIGLACKSGIFVGDQRTWRRIDPFTHTNTQAAYDQGPLYCAHLAASPDGTQLVAGHLDGKHTLFNAALQPTSFLPKLADGPHQAAFHPSGQLAHNGVSGMFGKTQFAHVASRRDKEELVTLEDDSRCHSMRPYRDGFIIGDMWGNITAFAADGSERWTHHIGGPIYALDIAQDEMTLVVGTGLGVLAVLDLDTGTPSPFTIGTSTHQERWRWVFTENENLRW